MPGPLPDPKAVRRNDPTIPTTDLPVGGRRGRVPAVPSWVRLGKSGRAWWSWAWKTSQACGWSVGDEPLVARRAQLEDDLAALEQIEGLDFSRLAGFDSDAGVDRAIRRVAALATGRGSIQKQMLDIEDRLGLTPKGLAALRWRIVADPKPSIGVKEGTGRGSVSSIDRRQRVADAS